MSKMSLYQIDANIESILNGFEVVDEETGEIYGVDALEALQMVRDEKIENIACFIKNQSAFIGDLKAEEEVLAARRKAAENNVERLKAYLMQSLNGQKFQSARAAVSFRSTTAVKITDAGKLYTDYLREIPAKIEPDKKKIGDALKAGKTVDGAELETRMSCIIK